MSGRPRSATPLAGRSTPSASSTFARPRSSSYCSETWGGPGGGILALRGHASIQGSTDIPTLYNLLPGYLPMPKAKHDKDFETYTKLNTSPSGWWGEFPKYIVSLLKAYFGEAATNDNDWCYDYLANAHRATTRT